MPPSNILHSKTDPTMLARLKEMLANYARWYTFLPPQWSTIPPPLTPGQRVL